MYDYAMSAVFVGNKYFLLLLLLLLLYMQNLRKRSAHQRLDCILYMCSVIQLYKHAVTCLSQAIEKRSTVMTAVCCLPSVSYSLPPNIYL